MTAEPSIKNIQDIVKPSAGSALHLKRLVDVFNIAASTPLALGLGFLGTNFYSASASAAIGIYSIFDKMGDQKAVNVVTANENDVIRSHRNEFNQASGSFVKNQVASAAMNLATIPAISLGFLGGLGDSASIALAGFGGAVALAVGGAVTGWRAHRKAVEMSGHHTAIKFERLTLK